MPRRLYDLLYILSTVGQICKLPFPIVQLAGLQKEAFVRGFREGMVIHSKIFLIPILTKVSGLTNNLLHIGKLNLKRMHPPTLRAYSRFQR